MGRMTDLVMALQEAIHGGYMSFHEIAQRFEVPVSWVVEVAGMMANED